MGASPSATALAPASQVKPASGLEQSRSSHGAKKTGRPPSIPGDILQEMLRLYRDECWNCAQLGEHFGFIPETVRNNLHRAGMSSLRKTRAVLRKQRVSAAFRPPAPSRLWCLQCERNVLVAEADRCSSAFCKARQEAA